MFLKFLGAAEHLSSILQTEVNDQTSWCQLHIVEVADCKQGSLVGWKFNEGQTWRGFVACTKVTFKVSVTSVNLYCLLGISQDFGLSD